jgi:hypothetical protein
VLKPFYMIDLEFANIKKVYATTEFLMPDMDYPQKEYSNKNGSKIRSKKFGGALN